MLRNNRKIYCSFRFLEINSSQKGLTHWGLDMYIYIFINELGDHWVRFYLTKLSTIGVSHSHCINLQHLSLHSDGWSRPCSCILFELTVLETFVDWLWIFTILTANAVAVEIIVTSDVRSLEGYFDGLVQDCSISIAHALEIVQSHTNRSICKINQYLTHWGRDKMVAIFQTMFSNAFSWMKMYEFRLRFL